MQAMRPNTAALRKHQHKAQISESSGTIRRPADTVRAWNRHLPSLLLISFLN